MIAIVVPKFVRQPGETYSFPLGLAYISAVCKKACIEVECVNLNHSKHSLQQSILQLYKKSDLRAVFTGGLSIHYKHIKEIIDVCAKVCPDVVTVVGGGIISSEPELMLDALSAHIGVIGEGDITAPQLARAIEKNEDLADIAGLIYRQNGAFVTTPKRAVVSDINALPFPDLEGFDFGSYLQNATWTDTRDGTFSIVDNPRILPITASRSCPFDCTFCFHPLGKSYRRRSLDSFFLELDHWLEKYDINFVHLLDELFGFHENSLLAFCERIKQYKLKWTVALRVDSPSLQHLKRMRESGLALIRYGLESACDDILASMQKKVTIHQIEHALHITRQAGIAMHGNFLFGDPQENEQTIDKTITWWKKHPQYDIFLSPLIPYPGTAVYKNCLRTEAIPDKLAYIKSGCPPVNASSMPDADYYRLLSSISTLQSTQRLRAQVTQVERETYLESRKSWSYRIQVRCPSCGQVNQYKNVHFSLVNYFKVFCRKCQQRMDVSTKAFDEIGKHILETVTILDKLARDKQEITLLPCVPEKHFHGPMEIFNFDWQRLNIIQCLDNRETVALNKYLGQFPVLNLCAHTISESCQGHTFFILAENPGQAIQKLQLEFQIPLHDIVSLHPVRGQVEARTRPARSIDRGTLAKDLSYQSK